MEREIFERAAARIAICIVLHRRSSFPLLCIFNATWFTIPLALKNAKERKGRNGKAKEGRGDTHTGSSLYIPPLDSMGKRGPVSQGWLECSGGVKKKETNLIVRLGLWPVGTVAEAVQTDGHGEERNRCRSAIPIFAIASPPNAAGTNPA